MSRPECLALSARDFIVSPERILRVALERGFISIDEWHSEDVQRAALDEAERLRDRWPDGEGFGSSDMTFLLRNFLTTAGIATDFVNHRLTRIAK